MVCVCVCVCVFLRWVVHLISLPESLLAMPVPNLFGMAMLPVCFTQAAVPSGGWWVQASLAGTHGTSATSTRTYGCSGMDGLWSRTSYRFSSVCADPD